MDGVRISQAITRIEAGVDRINSASEALAENSGAQPDLATKHEALRNEVSQTLNEFDQLIGKLES